MFSILIYIFFLLALNCLRFLFDKARYGYKICVKVKALGALHSAFKLGKETLVNTRKCVPRGGDNNVKNFQWLSIFIVEMENDFGKPSTLDEAGNSHL